MSFRGAMRRGIPQDYLGKTRFEGFLAHFSRFASKFARNDMIVTYYLPLSKNTQIGFLAGRPGRRGYCLGVGFRLRMTIKWRLASRPGTSTGNT